MRTHCDPVIGTLIANSNCWANYKRGMTWYRMWGCGAALREPRRELASASDTRATTRAHETCRTFLDGTSYVETSTKLHLAYLCKHFAVAYWFLINVFHHCFVDKFFVHEKIKKRICRLQTFNGWAMCWWKEIFLHVQFHTIRHYLATKTYPLVDMPGTNEQPDYDGGEPNCRV